MASMVPIYYLCKLEFVFGEGQYIVVGQKDVNSGQPIRFGTSELYDVDYNETTLVGSVIAMGRTEDKLKTQIKKLLQGEELSQKIFNTQSSQSQPKSQTSYSQVATSSRSKLNHVDGKEKTVVQLVKSKNKKESDSILSEWSNSQDEDNEIIYRSENNTMENLEVSPPSPSLLADLPVDSTVKRPRRKTTRRIDPTFFDENDSDATASETDWEPSPEKSSIFNQKTVVKQKKSLKLKEIKNRPSATSNNLRKPPTKNVQLSSFSQGSGTDTSAQLKRKIALLEAENSSLKVKKALVPGTEKTSTPTSHSLAEDNEDEDLNNDIKMLGTYEDSNDEMQVVQVDRFKYGLINFREPISAVKKLSVLVFKPEILANSTYTGKKSNAHLKCYENGLKTVKEQLCPHLLGIVVDHTLRRFKKLQKDGMFREKKSGNTRQLLATDLISSIQVKCACLSATKRY